jgi:hypothetical protein
MALAVAGFPSCDHATLRALNPLFQLSFASLQGVGFLPPDVSKPLSCKTLG